MIPSKLTKISFMWSPKITSKENYGKEGKNNNVKHALKNFSSEFCDLNVENQKQPFFEEPLKIIIIIIIRHYTKGLTTSKSK